MPMGAFGRGGTCMDCRGLFMATNPGNWVAVVVAAVLVEAVIDAGCAASVDVAAVLAILVG